MGTSIKQFLLSHEPFRPTHMGQWVRTRYLRSYLRRIVKKTAVRDVLDAGCGIGMHSKILTSMIPTVRIRAVDIKAHKEWKEYSNDNVTFDVLDLRQLTAESAYDLVMSIDVLEHISQTDTALSNLVQSLRTGGYLFLMVPSDSEEMYIFPRSWFARFHEWEQDEHVGTQYTLHELAAKIHSMGMDIVELRYTFTFFGKLAWEIETLLHWGGPAQQRARILIMPLLKMLGLLDMLLPIGTGNNLILARKR